MGGIGLGALRTAMTSRVNGRRRPRFRTCAPTVAEQRAERRRRWLVTTMTCHRRRLAGARPHESFSTLALRRLAAPAVRIGVAHRAGDGDRGCECLAAPETPAVDFYAETLSDSLTTCYMPGPA